LSLAADSTKDVVNCRTDLLGQSHRANSPLRPSEELDRTLAFMLRTNSKMFCRILSAHDHSQLDTGNFVRCDFVLYQDSVNAFCSSRLRADQTPSTVLSNSFSLGLISRREECLG